MRKYAVAIAVILLVGCLAAGALAQQSGAERFFGRWTSGNIELVIGPEGEGIEVCATRTLDDDERYVLEYSRCWYDKETDTLQGSTATFTHELYDEVLESWEELDWSLSDLCFVEFRLSEDGATLTWDDDELEPIELTRMLA